VLTDVLFAKVVCLGAPLIKITEAAAKLDPVTVSVGGVVVPAPTAAGVSAVIVGTGLLTANFTVFEEPPPGGGFTTAIFTAPLTAISLPGIPTRSDVLLTLIGVRSLPFAVTID
jgi:hypothetical protein